MTEVTREPMLTAPAPTASLEEQATYFAALRAIPYPTAQYEFAEVEDRHDYRLAHIHGIIVNTRWPSNITPTYHQLATLLNDQGIYTLSDRNWNASTLKVFLKGHDTTLSALCALWAPHLEHHRQADCYRLFQPTAHRDILPTDDPQELSRLLHTRAEERKHAAEVATLVRSFFETDLSLRQNPDPSTTGPRYQFERCRFPWREVCDRLNSLGSATPTGHGWSRATLSQFFNRWRIPNVAWLQGVLLPVPDILNLEDTELEWMSETDVDDYQSSLLPEGEDDEPDF